jgi:hypothetical protein
MNNAVIIPSPTRLSFGKITWAGLLAAEIRSAPQKLVENVLSPTGVLRSLRTA